LLESASANLSGVADPNCRNELSLVMFDRVAGAAPVPPPTTIAFEASAAELAQVVPLEKYGIPPDVPAIVNAGVVVAVAIETMPPVQLTLVTVPEPPPPPTVSA
jgi:hypothetical protein